MEVYKRYASREHHVPLLGTNDTNIDPSAPAIQDTVIQSGSTYTGGIRLNLLLAQPGNISNINNKHAQAKASVYDESFKDNQEWLKIFPHAAYFHSVDSFFGHVIIMVYENPSTGKTCTTSFTKFGSITYENLILDARSRFWPSCENLLPIYQKSNVRRALAISNLKNYNRIANSAYGDHIMKLHWDETTAGNLANNMKLITEQKPFSLGLQILEMGLLQQQVISSLVLDIVYDNAPTDLNQETIEENNRIVFLLGNQLDQLFDPLLEYSPEALEIIYKPPTSTTAGTNTSDLELSKHPLISSIVDELLTIQTNYTMGLVSLLQDFIIPLRIHVLSAASNAGISKINQVLPPTIDEVTRINCILLDSLVKAAKFGPLEVFRATGIVLPYFYKPFIRHEANLKNFGAKLNRFYEKNKEKIFDNEQVNRGKYTIREIDSIICGSLLELSKIKLILSRLFDAVSISMKNDTNYMKSIDVYYKSAVEVVNAFGFEDISQQESTLNRQRIFTPTGKILSEVTSHWPIELQYGWLSRKVVGIYELQNVKPKYENEIIDILIIFSDHLLFLTIKDQEYTSKMIIERKRRKSTSKRDEKIKMISISDILMHALVNEKPLPEGLPTMEVNCWCDINEVIVSSYKGGNDDEFLRFFITSTEGFKDDVQSGEAKHVSTSFSRNYKVLQRELKRNKDAGDGSHVIIELINKAKILNKNQPFHLFKTIRDKSLTMYSAAHELTVYSEEKCKSPFALFLNLTQEQVTSYFNKNKNIFMIMNASFINDHQIHIEGYNRIESFRLNEIIECDDLKNFILETISEGFRAYINFYNEPLRNNLIESYESDIDFYLQSFVNSDYAIARQRVSSDDDSRSVMTRASNMNISMVHSIPEAYVAKYNKTSNRPPVGQKKRSVEEIQQDTPAATGSPPSKKRKKSFFRKLFGGLFKSSKENKNNSTSNANKPKSQSLQKAPTVEVKKASKIPLEKNNQLRPVPLHSKPAESKQVLEQRLPSKMSTIGEPNLEYPEVNNLYTPQPIIKRHSEHTIPEIQALRDPSLGQSQPAPYNEDSNHNNTDYQVDEVVNNTIVSDGPPVPEVTTVQEIVSTPNIQLPPHRKNQYTVIQPQGVEIGDISVGSDVTAQPFRGPQQRGGFNDSKSILSKKHMSLTEENVLVLDGLHSYSYRHRLNKLVDSDLSKSFQTDLYKDGETNWVTITRENSSIFNAEINALKEDANMDTEDVISVYSEARTQSRNVSHGSTIDPADISQLYKQRIISGKAPEDLRISSIHSDHISSLMRDPSIKSLNSFEIMEEFGKEIDAKFAHLDVITEYDDDYIDEDDEDETAGFDFNTSKNSLHHEKQYQQEQAQKRQTVLEQLEEARRKSSVSTEEDFYSPDEFSREELLVVNKPTNPLQQPFLNSEHEPEAEQTFKQTGVRHQKYHQHNANNTSISSEATIINENNPVQEGNKLTEKNTKEQTLNDSVDLLANAYSTSYLSELLEGKLRFDYEDEAEADVYTKRNSLASPKINVKETNVSQSPSLIYLASYIRSGQTIRKEMNKIITGESQQNYKYN